MLAPQEVLNAKVNKGINRRIKFQFSGPFLSGILPSFSLKGRDGGCKAEFFASQLLDWPALIQCSNIRAQTSQTSLSRCQVSGERYVIGD